MTKALWLFIGVSLIVAPASADGHGDFAAPEATPNQASDATFDPRLPPVLPGEEVSDGQKTMRVWSSSGPVPVAQPPEPFESRREKSALEGISAGGIDIVVDQRKDPRGRDEGKNGGHEQKDNP